MRTDAAERLLNDPIFRESCEAIREQIVKRLESVNMDGKEETNLYVLELVRTLQAQIRQEKLLWQAISFGKAKEEELERRKSGGML